MTERRSSVPLLMRERSRVCSKLRNLFLFTECAQVEASEEATTWFTIMSLNIPSVIELRWASAVPPELFDRQLQRMRARSLSFKAMASRTCIIRKYHGKKL